MGGFYGRDTEKSAVRTRGASLHEGIEGWSQATFDPSCAGCGEAVDRALLGVRAIESANGRSSCGGASGLCGRSRPFRCSVV